MASTFSTPNFMWSDGSGFCFDLVPRHVITGWVNVVSGGVYDIPVLPAITYVPTFTGWSNWVDKFWKDYRFANRSDKNAVANIFPEVDDPWMFTEYLYQGTQKGSDWENSWTINKGIVEPPLVRTDAVTRTYTLMQNNNLSLSTKVSFFNNQPATIMDYSKQTVYGSESMWQSIIPPKLTYWESDLQAMGWVETLPDGTTNTQFDKMPSSRRAVQYANPVVNTNVRLYRHQVWSNCTRWGQSGNIPARILEVTAPKEYFAPASMFTGKIVPQVSIESGIPLYDNIIHADQGEQRVIFYSSYGNTMNGQIGLWDVVPQGPNGRPSGVFTYPVHADLNGADLIGMPRNNQLSLHWNTPQYVSGDLVHRGCQFWKGSEGLAHCDYYTQFSAQFSSLWSNVFGFNGATIIDVLTVDQFNPAEEQIVVSVAFNGGSTQYSLADCGKAFKLVADPQSGMVTGIRMVQANGTQVPPVSALDMVSNGGFSTTSPPFSLQLTVERYKSSVPSPNPALCAMYTDTGAVGIKAYNTAGGKCPYYTPLGARVVGSYSAVAANGSEWAYMGRGYPPGYKKKWYETQTAQIFNAVGAATGIGMGIPSFLAFMYAQSSSTSDPYTAGLPSDDYQRVTITYVPETKSVAAKQTYYDTSDGKPKAQEPEQDLKVVAGTGFNALDTTANAPYGGVDTPFFGFVNVINYRVMKTVQHCYRGDKCDTIITDPKGSLGFRRGLFSNVNFISHALSTPGYPALDGTSRYCNTGNSRCPYSNMDRRAAEYSENYKILLREILTPFRRQGVSAFAAMGIQEAFLVNGKIKFLTSADVVPAQANGTATYQNAMCVAVGMNTAPLPVLGHYPPVVLDDNGAQWRIYFFYDRPSWDSLHAVRGRVFAHLVQFNDDDQPCYMTLPTGYSIITPGHGQPPDPYTTLYGDATKIPWVVELEDEQTSVCDYVPPEGNCMMTTNAQPFAGGRNPEYRDMSLRGRNLRMKFGGIIGADMSAATPTNQFGGPLFNTAQATGVGSINYWIERYGEWILDGRLIAKPPNDDGSVSDPSQQTWVSIDARIVNHPPVVGKAWPINGTPGSDISTPDNPGADAGESKYAAQAHTYSNDTPAYLTWLRANWRNLIPLGDDGNPIPTSAPSCDTSMLPSQRTLYRCNVCGVSFNEEEINFFQHPSRGALSLYPIPSGAPNTAVRGCPRGDGGYLYPCGSYDRFPKTYAAGYVDVWAPPGTTVKHDAFFWKAPTIITRLHETQISQKLGAYNPIAGGYPMNQISTVANRYGPVPVGHGRHYDAGIDRRMVVPFATKGETIQVVYDRVKALFHLKDTDNIILARTGLANQVVTDLTMTIQDDDVLHFKRQFDVEYFYEVGVPVSAGQHSPAAIIQQALVQADAAMPDVTRYPDTPKGLQAFQVDLRKWILDVVYGSLQDYASNMMMPRNAMADQVGVPGEGFDAVTGQIIPLEERLIDPYAPITQPKGGLSLVGVNARKNAPVSDGGLKMITMPAMQKMRNRITPMLAYSLSDATYTAGGDYTQAAHRSHLDRSTGPRTAPGYVFGCIPPQVLAATETGRDYFVEWGTGDVAQSTERAYYPVGTTWWRMNQIVGNIYRHGGHNPLHLDDASKDDYTGDNIVSTCTFFLHGRLPMDKEVLRAFLVFTPGDAPSAAAIGCQGQYTGFVGFTDYVTGNIIDDRINKNDPTDPQNAGALYQYKGNASCFWQHYHPYTTNHENDHGGYDHGDSYFDRWSYLHVAMHARPELFKKDDPSQNPNLLGSVAQPMPQGIPISDDNSINDQYLPFIGNTDSNAYYQHVNLVNYAFIDASYGQDVIQHMFGAWTFGADLVQIVTEHQIWKNLTYDNYDALAAQYSVSGQAQVNTDEAVYSFNYMADYFRNQIFTDQTQGISGWLNMANYDNSGMFDPALSIEAKVVDASWANGPQVIVQGIDATIGDPTNMNAVNIAVGKQAGSVAHVMNITDAITKLYNDRVARFYKTKLGLSPYGLTTLRDRTDTNVSWADRFHKDAPGNGQYVPLYFWNYRYWSSVGLGGFWLNDPWHHTPLANGHPVDAPEFGDPIVQTQADKDAVVASVSSWNTQGLPSTDPNYKLFHPIQLLGTDMAFNETSHPLFGPAPAASGSYWMALNDDHSTESFVMDVRQVTYETMRRPWRFTAPTVDSTNAYCPNPSCWVHQKNWTVGQLYANSAAPWGSHVTPSTSSAKCCACGTPLVGVIYKDGDNIVTVSYDPLPKEDVLITSIDMSMFRAEMPQVKHGCVVEYFNSIINDWRVLFTVDYDPTLDAYSYTQWDVNTQQWVAIQAASLPAMFVGAPGGPNGKPNFGDTFPRACHFLAVTASKIRFKVPFPCVYDKSDPVNGLGTCTTAGGAQTITIATLVEDGNRYVGRSGTQYNPTNGNNHPFIITGATHNPNGSWTFNISGDFDPNGTQYQITWKSYMAICTNFRIYGYPFRDADLTITPPGSLANLYMFNGISTLRMSVFPSQIGRVDAYIGDDYNVEMKEVDQVDDTFNWSVYAVTRAGVTFYKVNSGVWYYDYSLNLFRVPSTYLDPVTKERKSIWELNIDLYNNRDTPFKVSTVPTRVAFEYITGCGVPVNVPVEAMQSGPSYQLDRECIQFVCDTSNNITPPHWQGNLAYMTDFGQSVRLKNLNGQRMNMMWQVYNHDPIIWKPSVKWLTGGELGDGQWDDMSIMGIFSGGHGVNLSDPGPEAALQGNATGTVTFYGSPNTILYGNVYVFAKAVTTRQYHLADGSTVTMSERTGGYRCGAFVFKLLVDHIRAEQIAGQGVRTGVTCGVPKVLIYLGERKITDQLKN